MTRRSGEPARLLQRRKQVMCRKAIVLVSGTKQTSSAGGPIFILVLFCVSYLARPKTGSYLRQSQRARLVSRHSVLSEPAGTAMCLVSYSARAGTRPRQQGEVCLLGEVTLAKREQSGGPAVTGPWLSLLPASLHPLSIPHPKQILKNHNAMRFRPRLHLPEIPSFPCPLLNDSSFQDQWSTAPPADLEVPLLCSLSTRSWVPSLHLPWSSVLCPILSC